MDNNKTYSNSSYLSKETGKCTQQIYGNNTNILYVIKQKMKKDKELSSLLKLFAAEDNDIARMKLIEDILISFTDAKNIKSDKKGTSVNKQYLYVLESLDKQELISFSQKSNWQTNSEAKLADSIEKEFEDLKIEMYAKLMQQVYFKDYFNNYNENTLSVENSIFQ